MRIQNDAKTIDEPYDSFLNLTNLERISVAGLSVDILYLRLGSPVLNNPDGFTDCMRVVELFAIGIGK